MQDWDTSLDQGHLGWRMLSSKTSQSPEVEKFVKITYYKNRMVSKSRKTYLKMYFKTGLETNSFQNGQSALMRTFSGDGALVVK